MLQTMINASDVKSAITLSKSYIFLKKNKEGKKESQEEIKNQSEFVYYPSTSLSTKGRKSRCKNY